VSHEQACGIVEPQTTASVIAPLTFGFA